jgi:hypothetical protein
MEDESLAGVDMEGLIEIEKIFTDLPITLNLGFPQALGGAGSDTAVIGRAYAYRTKDDGCTTIIMNLDADASEMLKNLVEVFELKALGFAGMKRRPQDGR